MMRSPPFQFGALALLLVAACGDYGSNYYGGGYGMPAPCPAGTHPVVVGAGAYGMSFSPSSMTIHVNDTVCFTWASGPHSVVSGTPCIADNLFCSPANTNCATTPTEGLGSLYLLQFTSTGTFPYFCGVHCAMGMTGSITVVP